ncbi:YtfJ family protein, partial [Escherichia coli]|uniref:YtfJ family protein n=1 Tax=Escherichia coli TaxID=562 RepID=UPI0035218EE6
IHRRSTVSLTLNPHALSTTARALRRCGVPGRGVFTNKELQGGGPLIDIGIHKDGRVQWAKDGALTPEEVQQVMGLLQKLLK